MKKTTQIDPWELVSPRVIRRGTYSIVKWTDTYPRPYDVADGTVYVAWLMCGKLPHKIGAYATTDEAKAACAEDEARRKASG